MNATVLWRRLDTPGHDACRLVQTADGCQLASTAVFRHDGVSAHLAYSVECGSDWLARRGRVVGWLGARPVEYDIARTPGGAWSLNGVAVASAGCSPDLDFGFTPATNLLPLRRMALAVGQAEDAPAVWLNVEAGVVELLPQRYERRSDSTYWYEAPSVGYAALLEVRPDGFVSRYPGLWEADA